MATNKVYEVTEAEELVPVTDAWGQIPKYELLREDKVQPRPDTAQQFQLS